MSSTRSRKPSTDWDKKERSPGSISLLLQSTSVPIDHYSYESVELLKDTAARWQALRRLRKSVTFAGNADPAVAQDLKAPDIDIFAIEVLFGELKDKAEAAYLYNLPTSFALPAGDVDRLRAAAGAILRDSPEFQRLMRELGAKFVRPESSPHRKSKAAQNEKRSVIIDPLDNGEPNESGQANVSGCWFCSRR